MTDAPRRGAPAARAHGRDLVETVLAGLAPRDVEACPGSLVVHADGRVECLDDPACATDPALHVGMIACAEALVDRCCERRTS